MNAPKISVITPMYNRKHYIEQCIDSVLEQTFQDYELIVRDDGSTDGSADFVAEKYEKEISSDKIKLRRNEKNIGEFPTVNKLLREASGKYIMILHSDDMYLPHALAHMYEVAENFKADVVHSSKFLIPTSDGIIEKETELKINFHDLHQVDKPEVMSDDLLERFKEWHLEGTFMDNQYNIFNRKFLTENDLRFHDFGGHTLFALEWIMKAKVFVKTPTSFYIYRKLPDSTSNSKITPKRVTKIISGQIRLSRYLDDYFAKEDFFKDNPEMQYPAQSHLFSKEDTWRIVRNKVYKNGITPELHRAVNSAFREYFGKDAPLPTFLYHWIHAAMFNYRADMLAAPPHSKLIPKAA